VAVGGVDTTNVAGAAAASGEASAGAACVAASVGTTVGKTVDPVDSAPQPVARTTRSAAHVERLCFKSVHLYTFR